MMEKQRVLYYKLSFHKRKIKTFFLNFWIYDKNGNIVIFNNKEKLSKPIYGGNSDLEYLFWLLYVSIDILWLSRDKIDIPR